jgi:SH3-like domain-containing protein
MTVLTRLTLACALALLLVPAPATAQTADPVADALAEDSSLFRKTPANSDGPSDAAASPADASEEADAGETAEGPEVSAAPASSSEGDAETGDAERPESPPEADGAEADATEGESSARTLSVTVDTGNVRAEPPLSGALVTRIQEGDEVAVVAEEGDWFRVRIGDETEGWAHKGLFGEAELPGRAGDGIRPGNDLAVTVGTGNLRKAPELDAEVVERLSGGQTVTVTAVQKDWFAVRTADGTEGWTHWTLYRQPAEATIEAVRIERSRTGEEKIHFLFDGEAPPRVFLLEKEYPRLVCDFENTALGPDIPKEEAVSGRLILRIRSARRGSLRTAARVVLDLADEKIYEFQHFFVEEQLYTLVVAGE